MRCLFLLLACFPLTALALDYRVEIDAPSALLPVLQNNLDLVQLREDETLTERDLAAMVENTPQEAARLLETEGYFAPQIKVGRDGDTLRVTVQPGEAVTVLDVDIQLRGALREEADYQQYLATVLADWPLPLGAVFRQDDWDDGKKLALRPLLQDRFPLARIAASRVEIDPAGGSARLSLTVDSGPRVRYGPLRVEGASRYPEAVVRGQANFREGGIYRQRDIRDYQASLEKDSHYSAVVVAPLWEQMQDDAVPVLVTVSELPRQKVDLGLNYSTGDGAGFRLGYEHYNIFRRGFTGSVVYDWKQHRQQLDLGLGFPRSGGGYSHAINLRQRHEESNKLETDSRELGVFRIRQSGNIEARLGAEYVLEQEREAALLTRDNKAVILSYGWTQRAVDSQLRPSSGYLIEAQAAGTVGDMGSDTRFLRGYLRLANYWSPRWLRGTLVSRLEGGQVWAEDSAEVPASRLFKAGGAGSVRGYEYQSLGVAGSDGAVLGGRVLATASLEYQYPLAANWRAAVFADSGDAAGSWQQWRAASGVGAGVRWLSPIAPLAFDLARGNRDGRWRWNLNLGLAF